MTSINPVPPLPTKEVETYLTEQAIEYKEAPKEINIYEEAEQMHNLMIVWVFDDAYDEAFMWTQDFISEFGWANLKSRETFKFSRRSTEWTATTQKQQQQMAMAKQLMLDISNISKSLIPMYQELQKLNEFISFYKQKDDSERELNLKGIWVDYIDAPKPASIAALEKNYEYIVLRDLLYACNNPEDIDASPVNERLKRIAKRKLNEYLEWKKNWKTSLEKSKGIIEERIASFEKTIDVYKEWIKPMLRDVKLFSMSGVSEVSSEREWLEPLIPELGNWMTAASELDFWKGIKPKDIEKIIKDTKLKQNLNKIKKAKKENKTDYTAETAVENAMNELTKKCSYGNWVPVIVFTFAKLAKAGPSPTQQGGTAFIGNAFIYPMKLFIEKYIDWTKDPAEDWIKGILDPIAEAKEKAEKSVKKHEKEVSIIESFQSMFTDIAKGYESFKGIFEGISGMFSKTSSTSYTSKLKRNIAVQDVMGDFQTWYDKFKKAHGMMTYDDRTLKSEGTLPAKTIRKL
ncbi:MAG: hypothetical protein PHW96_04035 [Candidatus Nanoarchaeia archaeon]|nr:hypothetical protein [Candidatus Nanoarchaeia archaeon]